MENQKSSCPNKRARQHSVPADPVTLAENGDSLAKKPRENSATTRCSTSTENACSSSSAGQSSNQFLPNLSSSIQAASPPPAAPPPLPPSTASITSMPSSDGIKVTETSGKTEAVDTSDITSCSSETPSAPQERSESSPQPTNDDSNIGNESDSDLDYDDLDDIVVPSDVDDFMDDLDGGDSGEDDHSVASSTTTLSTGSVGSNTPSVVGESLESVSLGGEPTKRTQSWVAKAPNLTDSPALRRSLFSNIPPTINFMLHNETSAHQLPDVIRRLLKWRLSTITPAIVKRCASNSGFRLMRRTCLDWHATWGKHMKSVQFKDIKEGQKINHFPGTFNIGRKDRLWRNYHRLMLKHGKAEFGFLPRTFVLPADTKLLKKVWERRGGKGRWIVKPPALARGVGISVVNKFSKIPKNKPLVVQRYVARPYLINGTKFDLRLYLLVTSVNPLRLYLYDDGLVRFASNKYSNDSKCVDDVYMHLTNYSINKNSATYTQNDDSESCQGHKWTLKSLWRHFDAEGIDHTVVWDKVKDLMIKTVISAENNMSSLFSQNVRSRYSCFELFGFDILLDSKLKPWLIEVNISPSLHSSSSLDLDVKSPLATEVFNMARYHIPNRMKLVEQRAIAEKMGYGDLLGLCHEKRLYVKDICKAERLKHTSVLDAVDSSKSLLPPLSILDHITPDDTRQLVIAEDELATSRRFQRIFPTQDTHRYFKYFEKPRYYNLLLSAWEQRYSGMSREAGRALLERLCVSKHHLRVPANVYVKKTSSGQQAIDISGLAAPSSESENKTVKDDKNSAYQPEIMYSCSTKATTTNSSSSVPSNPTNHSSQASVSSDTDQHPESTNTTFTTVVPTAVKEASTVACSVTTCPVETMQFDAKMAKVENSASTPINIPNKVSVQEELTYNRSEESRRLSSGSEMDCGSVTPSPRGTPEHPGILSATSSSESAQYLAGNAGFSEILAGNAAVCDNTQQHSPAQELSNRNWAGNMATVEDNNLAPKIGDEATTRATNEFMTSSTGAACLDNRQQQNKNYNLILDN